MREVNREALPDAWAKWEGMRLGWRHDGGPFRQSETRSLDVGVDLEDMRCGCWDGDDYHPRETFLQSVTIASSAESHSNQHRPVDWPDSDCVVEWAWRAGRPPSRVHPQKSGEFEHCDQNHPRDFESWNRCRDCFQSFVSVMWLRSWSLDAWAWREGQIFGRTVLGGSFHPVTTPHFEMLDAPA